MGLKKISLRILIEYIYWVIFSSLVEVIIYRQGLTSGKLTFIEIIEVAAVNSIAITVFSIILQLILRRIK